MKAVAINGSPGRAAIRDPDKKVLDPLEAAGWDTEIIRIGGKAMRGCMTCMKCVENRNGRCIIENDPINDYLEKCVVEILRVTAAYWYGNLVPS